MTKRKAKPRGVKAVNIIHEFRRNKATPMMIKVYQAWNHMGIRCRSKKQPAYGSYGSKNIIVCERWRNSFPNFLKDMGMPPTMLHSIDRIDNNGNYDPKNCRWATRKDQARNRSNTRLTASKVKEIRRLHASGVSQAELGRRFSVNYRTIFDVVKKVNWKEI